MNTNMEKPYVVGIDIGGTNTVFGIVDARGTVIASSSIKTGGRQYAVRSGRTSHVGIFSLPSLRDKTPYGKPVVCYGMFLLYVGTW